MPASTDRSTNTRERILNAAERVIRRDGVNHLTLEAAAEVTGVSKGGLLYHFPSKEALLKALVARVLEGFQVRLNAALAASGEPAGTPGRWLRAYVRATFAIDRDEYELSAALAVAFAEDPGLLAELRAAFRTFDEAASADGLPSAIASMIRLAADGFWFGEALALNETDPVRRAGLADCLIAMTYSTQSPAYLGE